MIVKQSSAKPVAVMDLHICFLYCVNEAAPLVDFGEVIPKAGAYGGSVVAGWHGPYLEKQTLCQGLFPDQQLLFSHHWQNLKSHFDFFSV